MRQKCDRLIVWGIIVGSLLLANSCGMSSQPDTREVNALPASSEEIPAPPSDAKPTDWPAGLLLPQEFSHGEYYLMVGYVTGYYTDGMDAMTTSALLGAGIADIKEGRVLYERLNEPYQKKTPVFDHYNPEIYESIASWPPEYLQRVHAYLFNRRIVNISQDGTRVLCCSYPNPNDSYSASDWDILYETFEGRELIASHLITRDWSRGDWYREQKYEAISGDEEAALLAEYFDWTLLPRAVPYPPFAQEYENDALLSPDGKYYAFRAPGAYERDEYGFLNEDRKWIETPIPPYGHRRFGYYIRNMETGDTVFYETETSQFWITCWVEKDAIDALIAENEGKGPID